MFNRKIFYKMIVSALMGIMITGTSLSVAKAAIVSSGQSLGGFSKYIDSYYGNLLQKEKEVDTIGLLADRITISENIAFANVEEKLNIRKKPGTDQEMVGYLPKNGYCYIDSVKDGWAKITSGGITGYVSTDYLIMGEEAVPYAKKVGTLIADVTANYVNLRKEPNTEDPSNIIAKAEHGMELEVLEEIVVNKVDEEAVLWAKVRYEEETAYIAKQFLDISYKWQAAKPVDPPPVVVEETTSSDSTSSSDASGSSSSSSTDSSSSSSSSSGSSYSSLRSSIASEAQRYVGLRYVYGGNSLSSGADCSGYVLAVYRAAGASTSNLPRSSSALASSGAGSTISLSEARPGDMVFYGDNGSVSHVALYIGDGKVANMSSVGMKMRIDNVTYRPIIKIKNFLG